MVVASAAAMFMASIMAAPAGAASVDSGADGSVTFAGRSWTVKQSEGLAGPGPNVFSGDNVWVDRKGRLHLLITERGGVWTSSEVILDEPLGFGSYAFDVNTQLGNFDPNVVLGMFTWDTTGGVHNRELDIEISQFGNADDPTNAGFTVQPYTTVSNIERFSINARRTTHTIDWQPDRVGFSTFDRRRTIANWEFNDATVIPDEGAAQVRINLWLFRGAAPTDGQSVEVVFTDFRFQP